jgi:hypothetical protein
MPVFLHFTHNSSCICIIKHRQTSEKSCWCWDLAGANLENGFRQALTLCHRAPARTHVKRQKNQRLQMIITFDHLLRFQKKNTVKILELSSFQRDRLRWLNQSNKNHVIPPKGLGRPTRPTVGCVRHFLSLSMLVLTISETYSYLQVANGPS